MESATAELAALACASDAASPLDAARSGRLSLQELMERAQALQAAGQADAAALLYETWLAHTPSPLRHVACFNWGTLLSTCGRTAQAEAACQ